MKRFIPLLLLALLFCSCQNEIKNWVAMSVNTDDNTTFVQSSNSYYQTKINADITVSIFLLPEADDLIKITKIYSSAPEVLQIEAVEPKKRIIKAKALKAGSAQIFIETKSHGNSSTLNIFVIDK